jgi:WD40 repeat protein
VSRADPENGQVEAVAALHGMGQPWMNNAVTGGDWFVASANANVPLVVNLRERRQVAPSEGSQTSTSNHLSHFSHLPDGKLAVGDWTQTHLYDSEGMGSPSPMRISHLSRLSLDRLLLTTAYIPDGDSTQPVFWDLATGAEVSRLPARSYIDSMWLSEDASLAAIEGQYDGVLKLYDLLSGDELASVSGLGMVDTEFGPSCVDVKGMRWSKDKKRIFVADAATHFPSSRVNKAIGIPRPHRLTGIRDARTGGLLHVFMDADGQPVDSASSLDLDEGAGLVYLKGARLKMEATTLSNFEEIGGLGDAEVSIGAIAGLWRASDGSFVRNVTLIQEDDDLRFNHDRTLLVGQSGAVSVADGKIVQKYIGGLRAASPSGTLHVTVAADGILTVRDMRDGIELIRRTWKVDQAGDKPAQICWSPGETQLAISFSDSTAVAQVDLAGAPGPEAPISDLDSEDIKLRTAAIDTVVRSGADKLMVLRARLAWPQTKPTAGTRAAIQALDALAQSGFSPVFGLFSGEHDPDPTVVRWVREAIMRAQAGRKAAEIKSKWGKHPVPFAWPEKSDSTKSIDF